MNLPDDFDAEVQVIGSMVVDPRVIPGVLDVVGSGDFSFSSCRAVFDAVKRLAGMGHDVDAVSVRHVLHGDKAAQDRLVESIGAVAFPSHAVGHAQKVRDLAGLRHLARIGQDIVTSATTAGAGLAETLELAEAGVFSVSRNGHEAVDWRATGDEVLTKLEYRSQADSVVTGLATGLKGLDERTTGLHPGWLTIIGGRPGDGKTSLALQIALHAAEEGEPVMFVSREMSGAELFTRAVCSKAGVSYTKIRRSTLAESDWQRILAAQGTVAELPIEMYDEGVETVGQIMSHVRRSKPALLVVDYLQLMRPDTAQARRDLDIAEITRGLKLLAKRCQIPVIACAQLNRGQVQKDGSMRLPELQDLRDSGSQEQDADVVMLLHRKDGRITQVLFRKFRHGPTGTDELYWYPDITAFSDGLR